MSVKEKEKKDYSVDEQKGDEHQIILYNDDFNTFDHVIESLINICDHSPVQAEQCRHHRESPGHPGSRCLFGPWLCGHG